MVLEHEMVHIKRRDVLWKLLLTAAQIIHWYNPFVWLLSGEFERVCEMSCDDQVLRGKEEKEKREYGEMLLIMVMEEQERKSYSLGLSKGGKQLKERIDNVMKEKKKCFGKPVSACIFCMALFLNSLTVFAYEDVQFIKISEENEKQLEMVLYNDIAFLPGGENGATQNLLYEDSGTNIHITYEIQFIDEEGNIYPVSDDEISAYASCSHNYISGELQVHTKHSDGSCTIIFYDAKKCAKCDDIQVGSELRRTTYQRCSH